MEPEKYSNTISSSSLTVRICIYWRSTATSILTGYDDNNNSHYCHKAPTVCVALLSTAAHVVWLSNAALRVYITCRNWLVFSEVDIMYLQVLNVRSGAIWFFRSDLKYTIVTALAQQLTIDYDLPCFSRVMISSLLSVLIIDFCWQGLFTCWD